MIQLLSEDTGAENFNFDGFDFLEDGELYSNTLNPGLLEDDKDDFLIDDHLNTPVVNAGDFVPSSKESPDTSHLYTSDKVFATKLDAKKWCVETGKNHNCAIVVKGGSVRKRNVWTTGKGYRFELQCERGGVYRIHKSKREISSMKLEKQYKSMIGSDKNGCICTIKSTMGLLCSHEMQMYRDRNEAIPLSIINPFWRQLSFSSVYGVQEEKLFRGLSVLIDMEKRWNEATPEQRQAIQFDMNVIAHPNLTPSLKPDYKKGKTKQNDTRRLPSRHENMDKQYEEEYKESDIASKVSSRVVRSQPTTSAICLSNPILLPKSATQICAEVEQSQPTTTTTMVNVLSDYQFSDKKYFKYLPIHIIPFVTSTKEVGRVGNCVFEVVEKQLNLGNQSIRLKLSGPQFVREKILSNMDKQQALYRTMWGDKGYDDMVKRITIPRNMTNVSIDKWMCMPECGFIIAETFSTVVHYIGKDMSYTFAPTTVRMTTKIKNKKVVMGFVEGNHFIGLKLSGNCPLPPEPDMEYWKDVKNPLLRSG